MNRNKNTAGYIECISIAQLNLNDSMSTLFPRSCIFKWSRRVIALPKLYMYFIELTGFEAIVLRSFMCSRCHQGRSLREGAGGIPPEFSELKTQIIKENGRQVQIVYSRRK